MKFTRDIYKKCIGLGQACDSSLWTFIFLYTQLHLARTITDEHRAMVGMFECVIGVLVLSIFRKRKVIEAATRNLAFIQIINFLSSVVTRFLVIAFPATYMATVAVRNSIVCRLTEIAFVDLENRIYSGEERTDLQLVQQQGHAAGALIGSGIAWLVVGVSIETVCWIAVAFCFISYAYEIWLGWALKGLVVQESLAEEEA